ncbi:hypothetical protein K8I61_04370 [bacterium]|nr:hypothetical protein [bacterium]
MTKRARWFFMFIVAVTVIGTAPAIAQDEGADDEKTVVIEGDETPARDIQADKPSISNIPHNFRGMSGLVFTMSTRTLNPGTVEIGGAYLGEGNSDPDYTRNTYAFNASVGIPGHIEFGLHVPYVETNLEVFDTIDDFGAPARGFREGDSSGVGSIEGMFKWAFSQQDLFLPSLALGLGFVAPGDDFEQRVGLVKRYGLRTVLAMGIEINDLFFTDYAFAVLADGGMFFGDVQVDDRDYEEKHGEVHFGMIFPLHPRNFVTLIAEYEGLIMRGTANNDDENSFLGALRFTHNHIAVTAGMQYVLTEATDSDDAMRYVAQLSWKIGKPWPVFP